MKITVPTRCLLASILVLPACGGRGTDTDADGATCCDDPAIWAEIDVAANPRSTLSAIVSARTTAPVQVAVEFVDAMGYTRRTSWSDPGTEHELTVVGMRARSSYELRLLARTPTAASSDLDPAIRTFETGPLPPDIRLPESVDVADGTYRDHFTLVGPSLRPTFDAPPETVEPLMYALDGDGEVVWYYADANIPNYFVERDIKQRSDGTLMVNVPNGLRVIDIAGRELLTLTSPDPDLIIHHDNVLLPSGGFLSLTRENRVVDAPSQGGEVTLAGDGMIEWDADGNVVWQWSSFDHLDVDRFPGVLSMVPAVFGVGALDWTHGNGLFHREDTNSYLVSLRHQNWIVDVDRATGDVRWILGDGGDFTLAEGDDAPAEWFYSQHAPTMTGDGTILIYDNGNERPDAPDTYSRVVRYVLDEASMTATQVWSYDVEHYTIFLGDAVSTDDGGALVCAGGVLGPEPPAEVLEVPPDPNQPVSWRVSYGADTIVYRAKRIETFYPEP